MDVCTAPAHTRIGLGVVSRWGIRAAVAGPDDRARAGVDLDHDASELGAAAAPLLRREPRSSV